MDTYDSKQIRLPKSDDQTNNEVKSDSLFSNYFEREWQVSVYIPFFQSNQNCITDYRIACINPNLLYYLLTCSDLKLNWTNLSRNTGLTIDIINKHLKKEHQWDWKEVSANPGITMQDIVNYPQYPWDWFGGVSRNPNLTMNMVKQYPDMKMYSISRNPGITMQDIINHPEYFWDWECGVSNNPNLTMNTIKQNPDKKWGWRNVSCNPGITMLDIIEHPQYPWNWYDGVSNNPNLTMKIIKQFPDTKWHWGFISRNRGITMQDIINHPEYPWMWEYVSDNPNLTINDIKHYPDKEWQWESICNNPGITIQDISRLAVNRNCAIAGESANSTVWSWNMVFANPFIMDKELYVNNQLGRLVLVSMLDDYNNDTSTPLDNSFLVLFNDYHLSCILSYI